MNTKTRLLGAVQGLASSFSMVVLFDISASLSGYPGAWAGLGSAVTAMLAMVALGAAVMGFWKAVGDFE